MLGAGGMGVVYSALDTRLNRLVAIKVVKPARAGDSGLRARLLGEARAASALNHPNIVTVYEAGSEGDVDFIAMEFVEGETLARRIPAGGHAVARCARRGPRSRLLNRLLTQMERILEVNSLQEVTKSVVEAARESLVIGHA